MKEKPKMHLYQPSEERLTTLSHALGAVLATVGLVFMVAKVESKDNITIFALMIFSLSLIGVYTISAIYHGTRNLLRKRIWQKVDHAMVALILFGCATPLLIVVCKGIVASIMLALIFMATVINIALNIICVQRFKKHSLLLIAASFLLTIIGLLTDAQPYPKEFYMLLGSGFAVIFAGSGFYLKKSVNYTHFVWHISNIIATAFLYFAFYYYVL